MANGGPKTLKGMLNKAWSGDGRTSDISKANKAKKKK